MGRVVVSHADEAAETPFPQIIGLAAQGTVTTKGVFMTADRPLWLWVHILSPGSQLQWTGSVVGHVVYVWKGSVHYNAQHMEPASVICVEHGAGAVIEAGETGATLVHFHSQVPSAEATPKAGGGVHTVGPNGMLKVRNEEYDVTTTFWLDSRCANCDLWLHQSKIVTPRPQSYPHFHTEDEIIFVVQGGLILGRRVLRPGSAVAVDAGTVYSFGVDEGGLAFLNFRPTDPRYVMMSRDGPKHEPLSEREQMSIGTVIG